MIPGLLAVKIVLLFLFLGLSAFFSASETALFSLDSIKLKRILARGRSGEVVGRLLENPLRCLTTILAGNQLVNIAVSSLVTTVLIDLLGHKGLAVAMGVTTLLLLTFGEVTPKTVAIHNNERLAVLVARPLYLWSRIVRPFLFLATTICDRIMGALHLTLKREPTLTEEEFKTVIELGTRHGVVGKSEKEMVISILALTTTMVDEVMVPRTDVLAVDNDWSRGEVWDFVRRVRHSKLPVFKDSLDGIAGVLYVKDLFLCAADRDWHELVKPVTFIPETKRIDDLIKDFYKEKREIAVVVDEYGGTAGLVTLHDILEEIFGEIRDEFAPRESLIQQVDGGTLRLSGKMPVDEAAQGCGVAIEPGDYDTIAGYLLSILGRIPAEGERVATPAGLFVIEKVTRRRIKSVLFIKP
ncbi:MAG: hemolysin family protein [Deltaproteobacteria bacterium]